MPAFSGWFRAPRRCYLPLVLLVAIFSLEMLSRRLPWEAPPERSGFVRTDGHIHDSEGWDSASAGGSHSSRATRQPLTMSSTLSSALASESGESTERARVSKLGELDTRGIGTGTAAAESGSRPTGTAAAESGSRATGPGKSTAAVAVEGSETEEAATAPPTDRRITSTGRQRGIINLSSGSGDGSSLEDLFGPPKNRHVPPLEEALESFDWAPYERALGAGEQLSTELMARYQHLLLPYVETWPDASSGPPQTTRPRDRRLPADDEDPGCGAAALQRGFAKVLTGRRRPGGPVPVYELIVFGYELDLLEIHLWELNDTVDRFVILEASRTQRGVPKPLMLQRNLERFEPFLGKMDLFVVDDSQFAAAGLLEKKPAKNEIGADDDDDSKNGSGINSQSKGSSQNNLSLSNNNNNNSSSSSSSNPSEVAGGVDSRDQSARGQNDWGIEYWTRNELYRRFVDLHGEPGPDDLLLHADTDEIANSQVLHRLKHCELRQREPEYRFHAWKSRGHFGWMAEWEDVPRLFTRAAIRKCKNELNTAIRRKMCPKTWIIMPPGSEEDEDDEDDDGEDYLEEEDDE